ncbi:hypothetical protein BN871_BM_00530 [Paenibacillus sp. P22]|nr:hypothetical protein BN871_BM_00530 [Paenibacillus sp. P22]
MPGIGASKVHMSRPPPDLSRIGHPPLQYAGRIGKRKSQNKIKHSYEQVRADRIVSVQIYLIAEIHEIQSGEYSQDGGVFDQVQELVADRRNYDTDCLRQNDESHGLNVRQSRRAGCLHLPCRYGLDSGTDRFGNEGRRVYHKSQSSGGKPIQLKPKRRQTVIEKENDQKQWNIAEKFHISRAEAAKSRKRRNAEHSDQRAEHETACQPKQAGIDRILESFEVIVHVVGQYREVQHRPTPSEASRLSIFHRWWRIRRCPSFLSAFR